MERYLKDNYIPDGEISATYRKITGACPPHPHDFFELEYISDGTGKYTVDGIDYEIKQGMLFLMTPISFHELKTSGTELYNVMFSEKLCDSEALSVLALSGSLAVNIKEDDVPFFESVLRELCHAGREVNYSAYLLNALLCKLKSYTDKNETFNEAHPVAKGMFYIVSHFRENPSLECVADYAGFAPTYFSSFFKKTMGINFKEYLDRLRFDYAKKLAENTDMTVAQIASESGFDDYPNFIRRFKARFGSFVTELRKKRNATR